MSNSVKNIFDTCLPYLDVDEALALRIAKFRVAFVNKNEDHIEFFGGNLTGVQVVRFSTYELDYWFREIIEGDESLIEEEIDKLPTINKDWHVSSDVFNLSAVWLIHKFLNAPYIKDSVREAAIADIAFLLNVKFLTSLLSWYFRKFQADPQVAATTYANLSYKFILKREGSWSALLQSRALAFAGPSGKWRTQLKRFDNDKHIVDALNAAQGHVRGYLKSIYAVMMQVIEKGIKISSTSSVIELDGEQILRDKTKSLAIYLRYITSTVTDKNAFIKNDLCDVIYDAMDTMPPKLLVTTLEWMSVNYRHSGAISIDGLLENTLVHSFGYLSEHRTILKQTSNLTNLISRLRGVYTSSRSTDPDLFALRDTAEELVKVATGSKNNSVISSVRTGLLLYIVLRSYTLNHYSS